MSCCPDHLRVMSNQFQIVLAARVREVFLFQEPRFYRKQPENQTNKKLFHLQRLNAETNRTIPKDETPP